MSTKDSTLTQEYLQSAFEYRDGNLYWLESPNKKIKIGKNILIMTHGNSTWALRMN
jgi:bisphosphoglycerate-dependent phosphoglycerate mutase